MNGITPIELTLILPLLALFYSFITPNCKTKKIYFRIGIVFALIWLLWLVLAIVGLMISD